jgi:hypothetical protein
MYQAQTPGAANATTKSSTAQITIDSYPKRPQTWQITGQSVGVLGSRDLLHGVEDLRYSAIPSSDTSIPPASHNHTLRRGDARVVARHPDFRALTASTVGAGSSRLHDASYRMRWQRRHQHRSRTCHYQRQTADDPWCRVGPWLRTSRCHSTLRPSG